MRVAGLHLGGGSHQRRHLRRRRIRHRQHRVPHERPRTARRTSPPSWAPPEPGLPSPHFSRARLRPAPGGPVSGPFSGARRRRRRRGRRQEVLAQYPPVVAVVVTRNPGPGSRTRSRPGRAGLPRPHRARRRLRVRRRSHAAGRRACCPRAFVRRLDDERRLRRGRQRGARTRSRAPPSSSSATTTSCSTRPRCACSSRRRTARTPASSGPKLVERRRPRGAARGRPRHRPLRRAVHRHRARRARPGAARRRARRLLRHDRGDARARRPLHRSSAGFDPATFPGAEDLDLCWRARLAGARVLVVPDARVAHREAADERLRDRPARRRSRWRAVARARAAHVVLVAARCSGWSRSGSSWGSSRRSATCSPAVRAGARAAITAAGSRNLVPLPPAPRASRKRAQPLRHVHDRELRELQVVEHRAARRVRSPTTCTPTAGCASLGDASPQRGRLRVRRHAHAGRDRVPRVPRARALRLART